MNCESNTIYSTPRKTKMDPKMMVSNRNALFQDAMLVGGVYIYSHETLVDECKGFPFPGPSLPLCFNTQINYQQVSVFEGSMFIHTYHINQKIFHDGKYGCVSRGIHTLICLIFLLGDTLPETNSSHLKMGRPKGN